MVLTTGSVLVTLLSIAFVFVCVLLVLLILLLLHPCRPEAQPHEVIADHDNRSRCARRSAVVVHCLRTSCTCGPP